MSSKRTFSTKKLILALACGVFGSALAFGHGSTTPPPEPDPPPLEPPPPMDPIPEPPPPPEPPKPLPGPRTPADKPPAPPPIPDGRPTTPSDPTPNPIRPPRPRTRRDGRTARVSNADRSWRIWWEYNRERLIGMRGLLREAGEVTGKQKHHKTAANDKEAIRKALRIIALHGKNNTLRASALIALGRVGDDSDAVTFVRLLSDKSQPSDVHEGAALGLGMLDTIESAEIKKATRAFLDYNIEQETFLSQRARAFGIFAAGMRARDDDALLMTLLGRCTKRVRSSDEGAHLAFACGLSGEPMATPELTRIAKTGTFHRQRLSDVGRSHAVLALGRAGDPYAVRTIAKILASRSTPLQTRRACAMALGRWLRTGLSDDLLKAAKRPLMRSLEKSSDPLLRGFCALALGGAKEPLAIRRLMELVDKGGAPAVRPFAALALGLAARSTDRGNHEKIGRFLLEEMAKTKEIELASALSLSLGLARATDATEVLLERVNSKRLNAKAKGAAIQALGIMGRGNPKVDKALFEVLKEGHRDLVGDAALALGLLGRRSTAPVLLKMLEKGGSDRMVERTILALGHLGSPGSVKPLIEIAGDRTRAGIVREFACVALGLLGDDRETDPLFDLDADFNYFATTVATNELIRLY